PGSSGVGVVLEQNSLSGKNKIWVFGLYAVAGQPRPPGSAGQFTVVWPICGIAAGLIVLSPDFGSMLASTFCGTVCFAHSHAPLVRSSASIMPSLPVVTTILRVAPLNGRSIRIRS